MRGVYEILDQVKTQLESDSVINTVSYGQLDEVTLEKQEIYPLGHVILGNATIRDKQVVFNLSIVIMDAVLESKTVGDVFKKNNNEVDVLNTCLAVAARTVAMFDREEITNIRLDGDPSIEFFTDKFKDKVAGVTLTMDVRYFNDMTIC